MEKKRKIIIVIVAALIAVPCLFVLLVYSGAYGHLQNRKELLNYKNATASRVLSAEGTIIGKFFSENRTNITYEQIPSYVIDALIATEDARFYQHSGIDMRSMARVFVKSIFLRDRGSGGGSTITQQLAKNMFGRKASGLMPMPVNKSKEIILARRLERAFSKEEILTLYLNTISFGENIFGIETAAARFFNKNVGQLKIEESAVLIGMLKATTYYNPRFNTDNARSRRNVVLGQMVKYEYLDPHEADSLSGLPLRTDYSNIESAGPADYFLVLVKNEARRILNEISSATGKEWDLDKDGLIVSTTLNLTLQESANKALRDHLSIMQRRLSEQY
ncbi:MAG TPA: transglycosylase domain-containing protein, partial [Bacteroidales bacterium]|nr:transglycosylase domain-containing protein [Bacteroidales bacterium]